MKFKKVRFYNDDNQNMRLREKNGTQKHVQELVPVAKVSAALFKPEGGGIGDGRQITGTTSAFEKFKVFSENHNIWQMGILDPESDIIRLWNRVFLFSCLVALFIDPLFFYLPEQLNKSDGSMCLTTDMNLQIVITCFRTIADVFYVLNIVVKFQTAYVLPSSIVLGRGELVMDRRMIAWRYLRSEFFRDLLAAAPIPQIMMWWIFPITQGTRAEVADNLIVLIVFLQYIPRLYLILPLSSQIIKATGIITQTAWGGAAYNLLLYMLASHVLGASWYFLSFARYTTCLRSTCTQENITGNCLSSLNCGPHQTVNTTVVFINCNANNKPTTYPFGMFASALQNNVTSTAFIEKYFYCLWFGLQNLSCYGQNLTTTTFIGETIYAILIAVMGLVLFAHLIGNMQTYLQSLSGRLEEWRLKRRDTEEWMEYRQLPKDLRERVRRFVQYKWLATRGVDEDSILTELPTDLRRDIQRHLCLDLLLRVPFFSQMDHQLLDAISERLVSSLSIQGTYIVREGDPVTEMLFIIRGRLESSTTNGGLTGFFNLITLRPGDFCGEELLTWALLPKSSLNFPLSTRTVKALDEVEAFALQAEDLKFVANQFRRLHSKKLQHTFRFYSYQWRTWAACFIQAAWRRHKKRMMAENLSLKESFSYSRGGQVAEETEHDVEEHPSASSPRSQAKQNLRVRRLASRFAANTWRGAQILGHVQLPKLQKPEEPDFSMVLDD